MDKLLKTIDNPENFILETINKTNDIDEYIKFYTKDLTSIRPYFIISYGPSASGKSPTGGSFSQILQYENIRYFTNMPHHSNSLHFCSFEIITKVYCLYLHA